MPDQDCRHQWTIVNVRNGYIVTEGCYHCGGRASFFTIEDLFHRDTYADGDHRWRFLGSAQAVKFDLQCETCGKVVNLDKVIALMLCTECRDDCEAAMVKQQEGNEDAWVYVALCAYSTHWDGQCVGIEEVAALNEYFNSHIKTPGKKIIFVPCTMRKSIDLCQGEVIADVGMKEIY